jgi:ribonuclease BN (tRNA processing enzyme)
MGRTTLLVDCGPGTFANLQVLADPASIDAVVISHAHPDHWTDLPSLEAHARFALGRGELPVLAPAEVEAASGRSASGLLRWHRVAAGDRVPVGDATCTFRRTDHEGTTLAVRIEGTAGTVGYSADTGPGWALAELGPDLDLLLCEATFTTDREGRERHLSGRQAGILARTAGVRRLVITHRRPTTDATGVLREASEGFGGAVETAAVGREFHL